MASLPGRLLAAAESPVVCALLAAAVYIGMTSRFVGLEMGQIFGWSCLCAVGLPGAANVSHDRYGSPKQRQKGNDRDEEQDAHTCMLRIPKQAVRKSGPVDRATTAVGECGSS
jgi:hypothetical protein